MSGIVPFRDSRLQERADAMVQASARHCRVRLGVSICIGALTLHSVALADGHVKAPFNYKGSLEEKSQEAIIIFDSSTGKGIEDLILKISVQGDVDRFAWVIPFPTQPTVKQADAKLFEELFNYVERNLHTAKISKGKKFGGGGFGGGGADVEVLSRELVGAYETAVVKENVSGSLNQWLSDEGFQRIENGDAVIEQYRKRGFVFCCIKVSDVTSDGMQAARLHPLRFTFETGGRDGIYFPMKLTGLQADAFDVNLYVFSFSRRTLNARLNDHGYEHRAFRQKYRDDVPFQTRDSRVPTFAAFLKEFFPEKRFYLTNLQATQLKPAAVLEWTNDLWLFPVYRDPEFVPYDVRPGGPASVE